MDWLWWLGGALALGLVEILVLDVVVVMLIGGALVGALVAALGGPVWLQVVAACLTSVLLVLFLRPWAMRMFAKKVPLQPSGTAAHVGQTAVVVADVSADGGRVKLKGEVWTARTESADVTCQAGAKVQVLRIDGATAVVAPLHAPTETAPTPPPSSATSQ